MPFISEIEKEKLISTFKSLPKETVSGNGSGWVNLVKFAPALKMSGLNSSWFLTFGQLTSLLSDELAQPWCAATPIAALSP